MGTSHGALPSKWICPRLVFLFVQSVGHLYFWFNLSKNAAWFTARFVGNTWIFSEQSRHPWCGGAYLMRNSALSLNSSILFNFLFHLHVWSCLCVRVCVCVCVCMWERETESHIHHHWELSIPFLPLSESAPRIRTLCYAAIIVH